MNFYYFPTVLKKFKTFFLTYGIITAGRLLHFKWRSPRPSWQSQLPQPHLMGDYTITLALHGIITAKQLLYFKMAGAICSLCSLPHGQLYHFTRCVHGIITAKRLLYEISNGPFSCLNWAKSPTKAANALKVGHYNTVYPLLPKKISLYSHRYGLAGIS